MEGDNFLCDAGRTAENRGGYEGKREVYEGELGFKETEKV